MYHCYILHSAKLEKYYITSTGDLEGRLQRHNTSNQGFTSIRKPWIIKYSESFEIKPEALKRESQNKTWKKRSAIESLISVGSEHPDFIGRVGGGRIPHRPRKMITEVVFFHFKPFCSEVV